MDLMVSRVFQNGEPLFIGIVRDITEKRRIDSLRSQFISAASKEILGPLNVIAEAISLLQATAPDTPTESFQHAVAIAKNNSIKLQKLMSDLIEAQNLSNGEAAFKLQAHMVLPLVEEALRRNKVYSDIYQCTMSIKATASDLTIHADSTRFYQAMAQLLQYALKFTDQKSELQVRITEDRSRVKISINMAGKTLTEDIRKNLLLYFGQHNEPINQEQYAEGDLGLAIAKEIIEKMRGNIYIEKKDLENKSDEYYFVVEFPQTVKQFA